MVSVRRRSEGDRGDGWGGGVMMVEGIAMEGVILGMAVEVVVARMAVEGEAEGMTAEEVMVEMEVVTEELSHVDCP